MTPEFRKLELAKSLTKQIGKLPLNVAKVLCALLGLREKGTDQVEISANRLISAASGTKGGNTKRAFLPVAKELSTNTFVDVLVQAKDVPDYLKDGDPERTVAVAGSLITTSVYDPENGTISVTFNKSFLPILDRIQSNWVFFDPYVASKLRSDYALKIYCWILVHLGGLSKRTFEWHFYKSGEEEESVIDYFKIKDKKGYQYPSDIKIKIFEKYMPEVKKLLEGTIEISWSYIEKNRTPKTPRERDTYIESIRIEMSQKSKKKERLDKALMDGQVVNAEYTETPAPIDFSENDTKSSQTCEPALFNVEVKTIADYYVERIKKHTDSTILYTVLELEKYITPVLNAGWDVPKIRSLIDANIEFYQKVRHEEHIKSPKLIFDISDARLEKIRPYMKEPKDNTTLLLEKYIDGHMYKGDLTSIPAGEFYNLDEASQNAWLNQQSYDNLPIDLKNIYDERFPDWRKKRQEMVNRIKNS